MAMKRTVHRILGTAAVSAIALAGVACGTTGGGTESVPTKTNAGLAFGSADAVDHQPTPLGSPPLQTPRRSS